MPRPELRVAGVIYLTWSMTAAVRAFSVWLVVWLTAVASFPPCCWSMANAHEHQGPNNVSSGSHFQSPEPQHHHHGSARPAGPAQAVPAMSARPAHGCDTDSAEAVATPRAAHSRVDMRAARATAAVDAVPQVSAPLAVRSDFGPPGASPGSAFLNPLRI